MATHLESQQCLCGCSVADSWCQPTRWHSYQLLIRTILATGDHTGKSLVGMVLIGISMMSIHLTSACRFIDDNALTVVLPAIAVFVESVVGHAQTSFNTTKTVSYILADPPNAPLQPPFNWLTFTREFLSLFFFLCSSLSGLTYVFAAALGPAGGLCHCDHVGSHISDDASGEACCHVSPTALFYLPSTAQTHCYGTSQPEH